MRFKPYLEILKLVWPLALGMMNNAVMQFADRTFLARHSMEALEASLPASTMAWLFMCFFQSVVGCSGVFIAQYHGAGDLTNCVRNYRAGCFIAAISGLLMLPLIPLGDWIFAITAPSPGVAAAERAYYDIVAFGGVFLFVQMAALSFFTGLGHTRVVFWVNLVGNLLNVAIDPLLIYGFSIKAGGQTFMVAPMGSAGAAVATVFAQFVQCALLVWLACRLIRRTMPSVAGSGDCFWPAVRGILRFGLPAGGHEVLNMLSFTVFVFVTGCVGAVEFAASNACFTVNYLLFAPTIGFAIGAQTLVGHARGRGDDAAAKQALARTLKLALLFVGVCCATVLALNRPILSMFAPDGPDGARFMSLGLKLLMLMSAWMLFDAADVVLSGALKGVGDTKFVFRWMLCCAVLLWAPLVAFVFWFDRQMTTLWGTMVIYVVVICIGAWLRWRRGAWRKIAVLPGASYF